MPPEQLLLNLAYRAIVKHRPPLNIEHVRAVLALHDFKRGVER